jgi:fatty-acyl-CoA synthase
MDFRGPGSWRRGIVSIFAGTGAQFIAEADRRTGATWSDVYGSSECFALVAFWSVDAPVNDRGYKGGDVVSPDIQIRIVDPESGEELPYGERGELQIRGYNVLPAYYRNEKATAAAIAPGGWYRTGDLSYMPQKGSLVFLTRLGDSLRIHGFLVDPLEIEDYLGLHDAVDVVQVIGVPGTNGDVPVAFVRVRSGTACSVEELQRFCKERLASYKVPVHIFFVDEFPTTMGTNGAKIQKGRLREIALETLAARSN